MDKPKRYFVLPQLPKPHYAALQALCKRLGASQLEVVCLSLALTAQQDKQALQSLLDAFRTTAPSEQPPLTDHSTDDEPQLPATPAS